MGTQVHCKSFLPGYYPMRDLNDDSSGSSWPLFYGDKTLRSGHFYNGFMPSTATDAYPQYNKDVLKQKMLEHEAIFKNQVYELHRLYRIQRDMMEEIKRKELRKHCLLIETSSSSSRLSSQVPSEEAWKWHIPSFKLENCGYARPSMSGAEIVNFSLSFTKGHSTETGRALPQNGFSAKECEVLGSRPSKVRKKLFDLHLPADEYIDTEQGRQFRENNIPDIPSSPSRDHKSAPEGSVRWFHGDGDCSGKTDCRGNALSSHLNLKNSIGLSDLNEPAQADETTAPTSVNFLGCSTRHETRGMNPSAKFKTESLRFPKSNGLNSHGSSNGTLNDLSANNEGNERERFSFVYKAGNSQADLNSVAQCLQQDKLPVACHPTQGNLNKSHQYSGFLPNKEEMRRARTNYFSYNQVEPIVASHLQRPPPFINSSDLVSSCFQSVSSRGKPTSSLTQKLTEVDTHTSLNSTTSLSRISQPLVQNHDRVGVKWHVNGNSSLNPGSRGDLLTTNGFYHGSSLGSKEPSVGMPPIGFDIPNCNRYDNVASECSVSHGSARFSKSSALVDLKFAKDMNSNVFFSKSQFNEVDFHPNLEIVEGKVKCDNHLVVLPWFRAKQSCKDEKIDTRKDSNSHELGFAQTSSDQLLYKSENMKYCNSMFTRSVISAAGTHDNRTKETSETLSSRKILGVSIFENSSPKKEPSLLISNSATILDPPEDESVKNERKNRVIDINMPCDSSFLEHGRTIDVETSAAEKAVDRKAISFRNQIDLNSCTNEEEDLLVPSVASTCSNVKIPLEIDLEVPVVPESEEDVPLLEEHGQREDHLQSKQKQTELDDEFVRKAAEAIIAISSSTERNNVEDTICHQSEALSADPLLWFVEIVSSCEDGLKNKCDKESNGKDGGSIKNFSSDEIDYFEAMTLQLEETKEEDYMPKPFIPEIQKLEETGATLFPNGARRGHSKRGRQRRDFQRDILPGLASLSRHEVTEDLQIFGRVMRAAGYPWNSGLTRRNGMRNGTGRGRQRSVVYPASPVLASSTSSPLMEQLKNMEVGLEDRNLTGWGKTTRRPRRQRCPAGNPYIVLLT